MSFKGAKKFDNGDTYVNYLITLNPGDTLAIDGKLLFNGRALSQKEYYFTPAMPAKKNKDGTYSKDPDVPFDSSAATVDFSTNTLTAVRAGVACISFNSKDIEGEKEDTWNKYGLILWIEIEEAAPVECTKLSLNKTEADVVIGSSLTLEASFTPKNTTDKTLTWESNDSKAASVDKNGKVTVRKYSKNLTITATTSNGKKATCKIQPLFKDVTDSSKSYFKAVYWAVNNDITKCSTHFRPDNGVTRSEFTAFLYRLAGSPEVKKFSADFTDVDKNTKFYTEINWAVNSGIIKGFSDKTFRPNDGVTRGQCAIMLWRYAKKPAYTIKESPFTDIQLGTSDTQRAILWGNEQGIIKGYSDGTFRKDAACTRANVVTFMYRYAK